MFFCEQFFVFKLSDVNVKNIRKLKRNEVEFLKKYFKKTSVDVKNIYTESNMQTKKFIVKYIIDGKHGLTAFYYC